LAHNKVWPPVQPTVTPTRTAVEEPGLYDPAPSIRRLGSRIIAAAVVPRAAAYACQQQVVDADAALSLCAIIDS
jgi:hypothetical protein